MTESARLRIPYLAAAQAQKHVTHNEAMTLLDTLVQLAVLDRDLAAPPAEPAEGDTYIVAASATGAWEGWDGRVARFIDGIWRSYLPGAGDGAGWLGWVIDEDAMVRFDGASWELAGIEGPAGATGAQGQGIEPDATGTLSGRDAFDGEAQGFVYLRTDVTPFELYVKASGGSGDWAGPSPLAGAGGASADLATDVSFLALLVADLMGDRINIVEGWVDPFDDETDVDTSASSNELYDAGGDFYGPALALISQGAGTPIGNMTGGGALAAAFDGDNDEPDSDCASLTGRSSGSPGTCGKDFGAGNEKVVTQVKTWGYDGGGYTGSSSNPATIRVKASNSGIGVAEVLLLTNVMGSDPTNANPQVMDVTNTTAYRYYWCEVYPNSGSNTVYFAEVEFWDTSDLDLISEAFAASEVPTEGKVLLEVEEVEAATPGTDFKGYVSRADGAAWEEGTLALRLTTPAGRKIYEAVDIDLTGQGSDTAVRARFTTHNAKVVRLHGWAFSVG